MGYVLLSPAGDEPAGGEARVFFPGWGFDGWSALLFPGLLKGNLIIPEGMLTPEMLSQLPRFLDRQGIGRIQLIGWSMGANLGLDYALQYGETVCSLILAAMRRSWPSQEIDEIRDGLRQSPEKFMVEFYRKCFLGSRKTYKRFVARFQDTYLNDLDIDRLNNGLVYLERYILQDLPAAAGIKVNILHGDRDIVAPLGQRPALSGAVETIIPHLGHAVLSADGVIP